MTMSTNGYGYILRKNKWLWLYLTEQWEYNEEAKEEPSKSFSVWIFYASLKVLSSIRLSA